MKNACSGGSADSSRPRCKSRMDNGSGGPGNTTAKANRFDSAVGFEVRLEGRGFRIWSWFDKSIFRGFGSNNDLQRGGDSVRIRVVGLTVQFKRDGAEGDSGFRFRNFGLG
ncbi:hypothetical protein OROMI_014832 [Orobanche minor]